MVKQELTMIKDLPMQIDPHSLAKRRVEISAEYARDSELLGDILAEKPALWIKIRERMKSDKATDREWDSTSLGIDEMRLRLKMKANEKKLSAAKTMLDVLNAEARNQY